MQCGIMLLIGLNKRVKRNPMFQFLKIIFTNAKILCENLDIQKT